MFPVQSCSGSPVKGQSCGWSVCNIATSMQHHSADPSMAQMHSACRMQQRKAPATHHSGAFTPSHTCEHKHT